MALNEPGRTVVLLHFFEGISLRDIAERQAVPLETVRTRLRRTLVRLRQQLQAKKGGSWMALAVPVWPAMGSGVGATAAVIMTHAAIQGVAMSLKVKLVMLLVLVCVAGVGLQLVSTGDDPAPPPASSTSTVLAAGSAANADDALGDAKPAARDRARQVRLSSSKPEVPLAPTSDFFGKLVGLHGDVPWVSDVRFSAGSDPNHVVRVVVKPDGTFRAHVAALLEDPAGLVLLGDDRRYLKVRRSLSAQAVLATSPRKPLRVEVVCAALVAGRVVTHPRKGARQGFDGARISVHVMSRGQPVGHPVDVTHCDSAGHYEVRLPHAVSCLVLALPRGIMRIPHLGQLPILGNMFRRQGDLAWLPASTTERSRIGHKVTARDIVMRQGQSVRGRVHWGDGRPVVSATVRTRLEGSQTTLYSPDADIRWWPDGTLWFDEVEVSTDGSGDFELINLPDRACRIGVGDWIDDVIVHGPKLERTVQPPDTRCDFHLPASVMKVSVQHDGRAIAGAHIGVWRDGLLLKGRVDRGETRVVLQAGAKYRITGSAKGFEPGSIEVTAASGPMDRILILAKAPRRMVRLLLRGDREVTVARFRWTRLDDTQAEVVDRQVKASKRYFAFDDLPAGRYRVEVCRPRTPTERLRCVFANTSIELVVPLRGSVSKKIRLRDGGRLRVRAITRNGVFLAGTCKLLNRTGDLVPVRFQVANATGFLTGGPGQILARGVNECDQLLLPGRYELRLQLEGCAPHREVVRIEAGGIVVVEVVATPR